MRDSFNVDVKDESVTFQFQFIHKWISLFNYTRFGVNFPNAKLTRFLFFPTNMGEVIPEFAPFWMEIIPNKWQKKLTPMR